jgi:SAM-dependent methyltransferase
MPICPACAGVRIVRLGSLPCYDSPLLKTPLGARLRQPAHLHACLGCELWFRDPMPTEEELLEAYRSLPADGLWAEPQRPEIWSPLRDMLEGCRPQTLLDVGCSTGDFLQWIGSGWRQSGIEPGLQAARKAQTRGVEILGASIDNLRPEQAFGAISLIDVVEHLTRPVDTLRKLVGHLDPGGRLLLVTGTTDAWSWRLSRELYWYSALPEHMIFASPAWIRWLAARLDCQVKSIRRLSSQKASLRTRVSETAVNVLYIATRRMAASPLKRGIRLPGLARVAAWPSCWWTSARDHIAVCLEKE